jgi:Anaphase-promoting complex, subunit 10 (APC10)
LYLDYQLDESYTPKKLRVQVSVTEQDWVSALPPGYECVELTNPVGWVIIPLRAPADPLDELCASAEDGAATSDPLLEGDPTAEPLFNYSPEDEDEDDDDDDPDEDDGGDDEVVEDTFTCEADRRRARLQRRQQKRAARKRLRRAARRNWYRHLVRAHLVRISIDHMHQNGRDTHVRQVQLYGPAWSGLPSGGGAVPRNDHIITLGKGTDADEDTNLRLRCPWEEEFTTGIMRQYATIR